MASSPPQILISKEHAPRELQVWWSEEAISMFDGVKMLIKFFLFHHGIN